MLRPKLNPTPSVSKIQRDVGGNPPNLAISDLIWQLMSPTSYAAGVELHNQGMRSRILLVGFFLLISSASITHAVETARCTAAHQMILHRCQERCVDESALEVLLKNSSHRKRIPCGASCLGDFGAGKFGRKSADEYRDGSVPRLKRFSESLTQSPLMLVLSPLPAEEEFEANRHDLLEYFRAIITQKAPPKGNLFWIVEAGAMRGALVSARLATDVFEEDTAALPEAKEKWIKAVFARANERTREKGFQATLAAIEWRLKKMENDLLLSQKSKAKIGEDLDGAAAALVSNEHASRGSEERSSPIWKAMQQAFNRSTWMKNLLELSERSRRE